MNLRSSFKLTNIKLVILYLKELEETEMSFKYVNMQCSNSVFNSLGLTTGLTWKSYSNAKKKKKKNVKTKNFYPKGILINS